MSRDCHATANGTSLWYLLRFRNFVKSEKILRPLYAYKWVYVLVPIQYNLILREGGGGPKHMQILVPDVESCIEYLTCEVHVCANSVRFRGNH